MTTNNLNGYGLTKSEISYRNKDGKLQMLNYLLANVNDEDFGLDFKDAIEVVNECVHSDSKLETVESVIMYYEEDLENYTEEDQEYEDITSQLNELNEIEENTLLDGLNNTQHHLVTVEDVLLYGKEYVI